MTRKHEAPTSRRHVMIADADWQYIVTNFSSGAGGRARVPPGTVIKTVVANWVKRLKARENALADAQGIGANPVLDRSEILAIVHGGGGSAVEVNDL